LTHDHENHLHHQVRCVENRVKALALSLCHLLNDHRLDGEMKNRRRLVGSALPISIGGPGTEAVRPATVQIKAISGIDLDGFREQLETLAKA
jgi:hypothetical protein